MGSEHDTERADDTLQLHIGYGDCSCGGIHSWNKVPERYPVRGADEKRGMVQGRSLSCVHACHRLHIRQKHRRHSPAKKADSQIQQGSGENQKMDIRMSARIYALISWDKGDRT